jgi:hypothetical protein
MLRMAVARYINVVRGSGAYGAVEGGDASGMSVWYVARRDIWGPIRREERNVERCWLCALAIEWRLSIMTRYSGLFSVF